jgi:hypothetical protein
MDRPAATDLMLTVELLRSHARSLQHGRKGLGGDFWAVTE